jgi:hypothetical protein
MLSKELNPTPNLHPNLILLTDKKEISNNLILPNPNPNPNSDPHSDPNPNRNPNSNLSPNLHHPGSKP